MKKKERFYKARINKHAHQKAFIPDHDEDDLMDLIEGVYNPFILILDGIQDPHNLGACLRSADGAGVHALIAPKKNAASITETVRQVACGGAENVPFVRVTNLAKTMEKLKEAGIFLVATSDRASDSIFDADLTGPLGIVVGAEEKGVRHLTANTCDALVKIPMSGEVECLNVSVAAGVCLFEAVRQRNTISS